MVMRDEPFTRLDLNLLAIFDTIMSERSLTKAGVRLGMTQSAVSHSLARLREVTGDTLFERTGRGVRPTARAIEMSADVREALDRLRATLRQKPSHFCSRSTERTFLLDMPAGIDAIIVPELAARAAGSDGLSFRISGGRAKTILQELRLGETWLALDYEQPEAEGYRFEKLFEDPFVIVARPGHAELERELTLERFETLEQVALAWGREHGQSPLTQRLEKRGVKRRIKYAVPNLFSVGAIVAASDMVGVVPRKVARGLQRTFEITIHPCPFELPPMQIFIVWHESFDGDEGHAWLRGMLKDIAESL